MPIHSPLVCSWARRCSTRVTQIASALLIFTGCDSSTGPAEVASVRVTPTTWTFTSIGDTVRFTAEAKDAGGGTIPGHTFRWRVEPSGVVGIRQDGLATALRPGSVVVSATTDSVTGTADVGVVQTVASVSIPLTGRLTAIGDSSRLFAVASDARSYPITDATISFHSLDQHTATVGPTGFVKAVAPGMARIVATSSGKADTAVVEVRQDVVSIDVTPDSAVLEEGTTRQFSAALKDRNGFPVTDRSPEWSSGDTLVVTVSNTGLVTAAASRLGTTSVIATSGGVSGSAPVYVFTPFAAVATGSGRTCALSSRGLPYCWGSGVAASPLAVRGGPPFSSIGVGVHLACALTPGGEAYCWGGQSFGSSPTAVSSELRFSSMAVGYGSTIGLTPSGAAYVWRAETPSPTPVPGGRSFSTISTQVGYACATDGTGAAYCWGSNLTGGLGDGTYEDRLEPTPVSGNYSFAQVDAGGGHTCGITVGGPTYCWGRNLYGAFGDGTTTYTTVPVPAASGLTLTSVTTADFHTCGLVGSGAAYCWGFGEYGSLGDGTFERMRLTPVPVSGGLTFVSISAAAAHTCGLTAAGALYCWGHNGNRELGDGTVLNRAVPTRVEGSRP